MRESLDGRQILLYYLTVGQLCSITTTCCIIPKEFPVKLVSAEPLTVINVPMSRLEEWLQYPSWRRIIFSEFRQKIDDFLHIVDDIAFNRMEERLIKYLNRRLDRTSGQEIQGTHQDIANDLNATRESVSKLLKGIEVKGYITLTRNKITVNKDLDDYIVE